MRWSLFLFVSIFDLLFGGDEGGALEHITHKPLKTPTKHRNTNNMDGGGGEGVGSIAEKTQARIQSECSRPVFINNLFWMIRNGGDHPYIMLYSRS